ncbi:MAG: Flp pilus assembly protein CpaB [Nevskiaceae bacterium]|jgi:pilus assembly protein CpaB|nr:Flp pilus assembly protein CpaB [Nevskiaceae bacterium]
MQWKSGIAAMLRSSVGLGLVALIGGLLAAYSGRHFLQQNVLRLEAEAASRYAMSSVVVAQRDLMAGERLDPSVLAVRSVPTAYLPSDSISDNGAAVLLGRRLAANLKRGDMVQQSVLQPVVSSLSQTLPEGSRALTVEVDDLNAHAGLLRAGDVVDVYLIERTGAQSRIGLLQEKVQVLATGDKTQAASAGAMGAMGADYSTVTLLVDDAQARKLALARQAGELSFVLRAEADESPAPSELLSSRSLLDRIAAPNAPKPRAVNEDIELLVGGSGGPSPVRHWLRIGAPAHQGGV